MAVSNSSLIGANFAATGTTQLFALGTSTRGTDDSLWEYVCASGTFTTGRAVLINPAGTAHALVTANLTANANGYDIGFTQTTISRDEYGWVAKQGRNMYVACTGTVTAGGESGVAFSADAGRLQNAAAGGVGNTAFGIHITTSASTATASVAVATLTWPRNVIHR